jgi:hypothetical protein
MTNSKMTLEDVLDLVMIEEPRPSHKALLRWSERYPQYRQELADYFATWAVQAQLAELPPQTTIDEEKLVERGVRYALELAQRQGRVVDRPPVTALAPMEQLVLAAAYLLHGEGHAASIADRVDEMSEGRVLLATVFVALSRLEESGLVSAWSGAPADEPGDTRRYYRVTLTGEHALATAKEKAPVLKGLLGDLA